MREVEIKVDQVVAPPEQIAPPPEELPKTSQINDPVNALIAGLDNMAEHTDQQAAQGRIEKSTYSKLKDGIKWCCAALGIVYVRNRCYLINIAYSSVNRIWIERKQYLFGFNFSLKCDRLHHFLDSNFPVCCRSHYREKTS